MMPRCLGLAMILLLLDRGVDGFVSFHDVGGGWPITTNAASSWTVARVMRHAHAGGKESGHSIPKRSSSAGQYGGSRKPGNRQHSKTRPGRSEGHQRDPKKTKLKDRLYKAWDALRLQYKDFYAENHTPQNDYGEELVYLNALVQHYSDKLWTKRQPGANEQHPSTGLAAIRQNRGQDRIQDIARLLDRVQEQFEDPTTQLASVKDLKDRTLTLLAAFIMIEAYETCELASRNSRNEESNKVSLTTFEKIWNLCQMILNSMASSGQVVGPVPITVLSSALVEIDNLQLTWQDDNDNNACAEKILDLLQLVRDSLSRSQQDHDIDNAVAIAWSGYVTALCNRGNLTKATSLLLHQNESLFADLPPFQPVASTYVCVLEAASRAGNAALVNDVWNNLLTKHNADMVSDVGARGYNARLEVLSDPAKRLEIFDRELVPFLQQSQPEIPAINQYTIANLLPALLGADRKDELIDMIDWWVTSTIKMKPYKRQKELQNGMRHILIVAVQKEEEVKLAQELFDRYMDTSAGASYATSDSNYCITLPERSHFNLLLDGYSEVSSQALDRLNQILDAKDTLEDGIVEKMQHEKQVANQNAKNLVKTMQRIQCEEPHRKIFPDDYTWSAMSRCCESGQELKDLLQQASSLSSNYISFVVVRAAITQASRLGDPIAACMLYNYYLKKTKTDTHDYFSNSRICNVLLVALANAAESGNPVLNFSHSDSAECTFLSSMQGRTCSEAVASIFTQMKSKNSQTYCMAAMAYQHGMSDSDHGKDYAIELFRHATQEGISADGRMINALFRCFRDDLGAALEFWKMDVRPACLSHIKRVVKRNGNSDQLRQQNLLAAYSGLLYVCGCARRPDIALRIVYAMNKEGIEPMEISYNNYKTGKRARQEPELKGPIWNPTGASKKRGFSTLLSKLSMMKQYESLLYVECTKYNAYDRRTEKDKRLRIIV